MTYRSTLVSFALSTLFSLSTAHAQHGTPPGGAAPRLDGTSVATFTASVAKGRKGLPVEDRTRFDRSLQLAERLFGSGEAMRKAMHGTPIDNVVLLEKRMVAELDTDGDGVLSDRELQRARREMGRARKNANESAAAATLLAIASAQEQIVAMGAIDVDGNGHGEYAFFGELAGRVGLRTEKGAPGPGRVSPPLLSASFAVQGGLVERSGYLFQIWLPGPNAVPVAEAPGGGVGGQAPDATEAERTWCAYAWPAENGVSGSRVFFITQDLEVFVSDNEAQGYNGRKHMPTGFAAFSKGFEKIGYLPRRVDERNDGGTWQELR